jgi:hypothetical protein
LDFGKPAPTHAQQVPGTVDMTRLKDGIRTTTESNDPQVAKSALQQHAAEVTEFINDGMAAMHKAMMKNGGMMQRGMHGGTMATAPRGKTTPNLR